MVLPNEIRDAFRNGTIDRALDKRKELSDAIVTGTFHDGPARLEAQGLCAELFCACLRPQRRDRGRFIHSSHNPTPGVVDDIPMARQAQAEGRTFSNLLRLIIAAALGDEAARALLALSEKHPDLK